ncbi:MAG: PH domain-containing protein [Bacteroidales bacterium]|nr:PH domain-containing protein [Bacteroidales bacterium]
MANFIEKTLEKDEKVIFKGRLHWSYNFRYTAWGILLILLGVAGMALIAYTHYNDFNNNMLALFCLCVIICFAGIGLIGFGLFVRNRTEFAVTNTRFIQKDGIFDVKMTDIPLFKVETVNFYQTFFERMLNTGAIELVGSGGTAHRVEYVQSPYKVRNIIATYMKNKKAAEETLHA